MDLQLYVEYRPVDSVIPSARNARTHNSRQIGQLADSIQSFGFINPVLVDAEGTLVAGHARVLAAQKLGLTTIPTICIEHLSEAEQRAYMLADNRLAENAGWSADLLRIELEFLTSHEINFDVETLGFSVSEVDLLLGDQVLPASDDDCPLTPEPAYVVSQHDDLWQMGRNRVIVGDCRDDRVVARLMAGATANMSLSDPPFNVPIAGHVSGLGQHLHREFPMACGELSRPEFTQFLQDALGSLAQVSSDGSLHYVCMDFRHLGELLAAGETVFGPLLNLCVWVKTNGGMGSLYRSQHELILVFKKGKAPHCNNVELGRNGRYRTNVWRYAGANVFGAERDESLAMHPTVKPVQMLLDAMLDVTRRGDIVLDGFLGSGSTLIAAERCGRICYGIELDPGYVDVTIARWQSATGKTAILAESGASFDEIASVRRVAQEVRDGR